MHARFEYRFLSPATQEANAADASCADEHDVSSANRWERELEEKWLFKDVL
jgi:hypothetical protein